MEWFDKTRLPELLELQDNVNGMAVDVGGAAGSWRCRAFKKKRRSLLWCKARSKREATIVVMVQSKAGISCPMTRNISG